MKLSPKNNYNLESLGSGWVLLKNWKPENWHEGFVSGKDGTEEVRKYPKRSPKKNWLAAKVSGKALYLL